MASNTNDYIAQPKILSGEQKRTRAFEDVW